MLTVLREGIVAPIIAHPALATHWTQTPRPHSNFRVLSNPPDSGYAPPPFDLWMT